MQLVFYTADCSGNAKNCVYPKRVVVTEQIGFAGVVRCDHVCAEYRNHYRSVDNFIASNVIVMDCDNDHSENPKDWITAEILEEIFADVNFALAPSRHHMVSKDGKAARPKFHIYFECEEMEDASTYSAMKKALYKKYPFFDGNALDAGRFLFGADVGEVIWHEGWMTIDEVISGDVEEESDSEHSIIMEGNRNNAMSHFAGRVLKRYGNTDKAYQAFLEHAKKCNPPLEDEELSVIWGSAVRFFNKKIVGKEEYISPEDYNQDFGKDGLRPEDFSDIGEAKVLAREYYEELLYNDATGFLRYDGTHWRESALDSVGAIEDFLDMQLADAREKLAISTGALVETGIPSIVVESGGSALKKMISSETEVAYGEYLAAKSYYAFVMKCRNYRNMVGVQNAVKPMVKVDVEDLDADENLLNTPGATYDLTKGVDGVRVHNYADLLTKITACVPGNLGKELWEESLQLFFCHNQELIDYVQMTCGLAAIGKFMRKL